MTNPTQEWDPIVTTACLVNGDYDGYLKQATKKLRSKLPHPLPDFDDVMQELRIFALEAIKLYKTAYNVKFETFLNKHLNIRSMQWHNWANMPRNKPKDRYVYNASAFLTDEEKPIEFGTVSASQCFVSQYSSLVSELSERAKQLFEYFCSYIQFEEQHGESQLLEALNYRDFYKAANLTTLKASQIEQFWDELNVVACKHLEFTYAKSHQLA